MSRLGRENRHARESITPRLEELESRNLLSGTGFDAGGTQAVASGVLRSTEAFTDFVTGEYVRFLRRSPDQAGLQDWVSRMQRGMSPAEVEAGFVASSEYVFNHGDDPRLWLDGLYNDLLGRAPDSQGFNFWMSRLQAGDSDFQVADGFATSVERDVDVITEDYLLYLGRRPDSTGLNTWVSDLENGASRIDVLTGIAASREFFLDNGNDASSFIRGIYHDALNRAASDNEVAFWLSVYENNSSPPPIPR